MRASNIWIAVKCAVVSDSGSLIKDTTDALNTESAGVQDSNIEYHTIMPSL